MKWISQFMQSKKFKESISYSTIALIALYIIIANFQAKYWEGDNRVIVGDVGRYYVYLPAIAIHNDLSFEYIDEDYLNNVYEIGLFTSPKGKKMVITTFGMAIVYSPFFLIAHTLAEPLGYEATGYSLPYRFAMVFSSLVYLITGLFFLRKLLLKYYNNVETSITLVIIVLGTNLAYYLTKEAPMPHAYEFGLISIYLYLVYKWYKKPKISNTFWVGFLAGLITLIRPSNILVLLILFFWGITSFNDMLLRIRYFIKSYRMVIIMACSFILIWLPQFIYWYDISGSIFYNSYELSGSKFYFNKAQIINQWFSYRKGWLLYTPIMTLALFGFIFLYRNKREFFWPILIYFLAMVYLLSSWWSWWFGGGYSIRSYIDMYCVLAIPLAASIRAILKSKISVKTVSLLIVGFFLFLSFFQTYQYRNGVIHYDSMTKKAYWAVFLKKHRVSGYYQMLEKPNYSKARQGIEEIVPDYYSKD